MADINSTNKDIKSINNIETYAMIFSPNLQIHAHISDLRSIRESV